MLHLSCLKILNLLIHFFATLVVSGSNIIIMDDVLDNKVGLNCFPLPKPLMVICLAPSLIRQSTPSEIIRLYVVRLLHIPLVLVFFLALTSQPQQWLVNWCFSWGNFCGTTPLITSPWQAWLQGCPRSTINLLRCSVRPKPIITTSPAQWLHARHASSPLVVLKERPWRPTKVTCCLQASFASPRPLWLQIAFFQGWVHAKNRQRKWWDMTQVLSERIIIYRQ